MAQSASTGQSFNSDPILRYRPPFAQSLPVQILTTGIVLTLVAVLLLHLIFTAQYHWPLARVNYILQLTGVITLLASLIATLYVVFASTIQESQHWPYMLSYLAVEIPRVQPNITVSTTDPTVVYQSQWTFAQTATWAVMNATTSVVVQITHVHFLTLMYPSELEAKLIIFTLGPLAITSAVMQLLPLMGGVNTISIAEDIRNVCNATLSLLFTSALIIWGFFVNRRQAWRTDGGTAAFGAGAIILAMISTTLNFIYIPRQDQYAWMPKLMWAVVLWQGFLGWWWWAGAGMGVREVEELLRKEHKRQQKRKLKAQKRKEQKERAKSVWRGVTGAFKSSNGAKPSLSHQGYHSSQGSPDRLVGGLSRTRSQAEDVSTRAPTLTAAAALNFSHFLQPVQLMQRCFARLRHDHLTAAHLQAVERVERIHQVYGREDARNSLRDPGTHMIGWGLGSYSLWEADRGRRQELTGVDDVNVNGVPSKVADDDGLSNPETVMSSDGDHHDHLRRRTNSCHLPPSSPRPSVVDFSPKQSILEQPEAGGGSSMWWWGPLRKWRLQDSSTYR